MAAGVAAEVADVPVPARALVLEADGLAAAKKTHTKTNPLNHKIIQAAAFIAAALFMGYLLPQRT